MSPAQAPIEAERTAPGRTILVNGEARTVAAATLGALLAELGFSGEWLGTAVNGDLVPRAERPAHAISEGDRVEILSPMQGG